MTEESPESEVDAPSDENAFSDEESVWDFFTGEAQTLDRAGNSTLASDLADGKKHSVDSNPIGLYEYSSLQSWRNIRLMQLEPNNHFEAPLACTMRLTSIDDPGPYSAFSYAWGPKSADGSHLSEHILCNGYCLRITAHLASGLRRVRQIWHDGKHLPADELILWIDAICIDQQNLVERSEQVSLMDRIYAECSRLIIWLGDCPCEVSVQLQRDLSVFQKVPRGGTKPSLPQDQHAQQIVQTLFLNPWFRRRWVVQEALCPRIGRDVTDGFYVILLGNERVLVPDIIAFTKGCDNLPQLPGALHLISTEQLTQQHILPTLQLWDAMECSEDRDRVFALIGICKWDKTPRSLVSYTKSVESIYIDLAVHCAGEGRLLQVLACASSRIDNSDNWETMLPSWVPDWRKEIRSYPWATRNLVEESVTKQFRHSVDSSYRLELLGWICDRDRIRKMSALLRDAPKDEVAIALDSQDTQTLFVCPLQDVPVGGMDLRVRRIFAKWQTMQGHRRQDVARTESERYELCALALRPCRVPHQKDCYRVACFIGYGNPTSEEVHRALGSSHLNLKRVKIV